MASAVVALALAAACVVAVAGGLPPLPRLTGLNTGSITVSGISSGADFAAQFHVAYSDLVKGSAIFAGQPYYCAVTRFGSEPLTTCQDEPLTHQGPGCVGYPTRANCSGCPPNTTVLYDHCKTPAEPQGPGWVEVPRLLDAAKAAEAAGSIAALTNLQDAKVYLYRGTKDDVYMDGAVNNTAYFFGNLTSDAQTSVYFESTIPSQHALPSIDPWLSTSTCGVNLPNQPPAMENCGYDGAGAALQFFFDNRLTTPASHACNGTNLMAFNQSFYFPSTWPAFSDVGYVYIPQACANQQPCRLHISFHGCGMSANSPQMNTSYVTHSGFNAWADANNFVVLYPQAGGYLERNVTAPSAQLGMGCFDGYGQTGYDYAWRTGPQMLSVRYMITALTGM